MSYIQEGPLSHLSKEQLMTELIIHSDIKDRVNSDFSNTVSFGESHIHWIVSALVVPEQDNDTNAATTSGRKTLDECLNEVKERKDEWEDMWNGRQRKLEKLSQGESIEEETTFEVSRT